MKENEFVKKFGWKVAKRILLDIPVEDAELYSNCCYLKNAHSEGDVDHFSLYSNCSDGWVESFRESKDFINESIALDDLKRLVKSWELVEKYRINKENINWVLSKLNNNARHRIMKAWADVESCQ